MPILIHFHRKLYAADAESKRDRDEQNVHEAKTMRLTAQAPVCAATATRLEEEETILTDLRAEVALLIEVSHRMLSIHLLSLS